MHRAAAWNHAGPISDERNAIAAVVAPASLASAHISGRAFEPRTIVRGQDYERVALEAERLELREQPPDDRVDFLHDVAVSAGVGLSRIRRVRIVRQVRRAERKLEEERPISMLFDEPLGALVK